jgi:NADH-ubiquinone oxidoreductase chain 5
MAVPLMLLCFGSIFSGYFFKDIFVGSGTDFFKNTIPVAVNLTDAEFIPLGYKLIPTLFSFLGLITALVFCSSKRKSRLVFFLEKTPKGYFFRVFFSFLNNRWNFDSVYNYYFVVSLVKFAYYGCFRYMDQYFLKLFGPTGVS